MNLFELNIINKPNSEKNYIASKLDRVKTKNIVENLKNQVNYTQIKKNIEWSFKRLNKVDALNINDEKPPKDEDSDDDTDDSDKKDDNENNWPRYICIAIIIVLILLIIMVSVMIVRKRNWTTSNRESLLLSTGSSDK